MAHIGYAKEVISKLDTMLEKFYDRENTDIKVTCRTSLHDHGFSIYHSDLPELRDALIKARDRFKYELRKNKEEFQAL